LEDVFDRVRCGQAGLPVYRRKIGGGGTLLDSTQVFYQCIFHRDRLPAYTDQIYRLLLEPVVHALRDLGVNAELRETNEIAVGSRRIAGTGGGVIGDAVVVVGNVLIDFDYETMVNVWKRSERSSFALLASRALRENVTTLHRLGLSVPPELLSRTIEVSYARSLGHPSMPGGLTKVEAEKSVALAKTLISEEIIGPRDTRSAGVSPLPLKIAAGVFIHELVGDVDGERVRVMVVERDGLIDDAQVDSPISTATAEYARRLIGHPVSGWEQALWEEVPA
jgi:lipoate-protein ligase A